MARIVLENVSKIFVGPRGQEIRAVNNLSLAIEERDLFVLVGPSGCGKTTTLRLIAGLEDPTRGTIRIDERVVNDVPPKDRDVAMVFQNLALYPHMTALENIALSLKLRNCPKAEIARRVREAAALLDIEDCLDRMPGSLSGGERQRVALGRAIVRQPKAFLFDEPLSNLDAALRVEMRRELARVHARLGGTMIYVTHDQTEALTLGDRIAVMKQGTLQQIATPTDLYRWPANLFVAGFIGSPPMNLLRGVMLQSGGGLLWRAEPDGHHAVPDTLSLAVPTPATNGLSRYVGKEVVLGLRPEHLTVQAGSVKSRDRTTLRGQIELAEHVGPETQVHLRAGVHSLIARAPPNSELRSGQEVSVTFDLHAVHFFDPKTEQAI